jgi:hypothetical protein
VQCNDVSWLNTESLHVSKHSDSWAKDAHLGMLAGVANNISVTSKYRQEYSISRLKLLTHCVLSRIARHFSYGTIHAIERVPVACKIFWVWTTRCWVDANCQAERSHGTSNPLGCLHAYRMAPLPFDTYINSNRSGIDVRRMFFGRRCCK